MIKHAVGLLIGALVTMNGVADEQLEQGKKIFTQEAKPSCTVCHTLSDAGSAGTIGPNLDDLAPSMEQVQNAVRSGVGVMPAFGESLSAEQIEAVARYVATVTGGE
ncbi:MULTISPECIES: c-type cytochrome [Marinobacter]|uniref:Cytochrome c n=1 Tax=Marinobacter suaedae TaxID=3057675 RepID=A0ABT8VYE6_9GAMM|nr:MULTISPECIES: cytochrome c [unclassified Marinobacter]MBZ2169091.1 cytochrome c [Marinobacter sp. F4216]MDO3720960.1 cytochrome c [Marinobacter sp. chi1]